MKIQRLKYFCANVAALAVCLAVAFSAFSATEIASQLSPSNRVWYVGGSDSYDPIVTPDGRFVLFTSVADNLVVGPGGLPMQMAFPAHLNVFLRDRQLGTTVLVSVNTVGSGGGNDDSLACAVSSNGQFVVFQSAASDLVAGDTNGVNDVFIRDTVNNTTKLVSIGMDGLPGSDVSRDASMTPDGRYVAFVSAAENLVTNAPSGLSDIYVRDLQLGVTTLASPGAMTYPGQPGLTLTIGSSSEAPILSTDGRYVVFYSTAVGLVSNVTSSGEIYLRDLTQSTTTWVSASARSINTNSVSLNYAISTNGQYIAYQTEGGSPPGMAFRYNAGSGATDIISTNGAVVSFLDPELRKIDISADGRFVGFTLTNKLIGFSTQNGTSIQLWDAQTGTSTQVSGVGTANTAICDLPRLDQTGRYVAFTSDDASLTTNSDGQFHIYVRDTASNTVQLADVISGTTNIISSVETPFHLSADGSVVGFDCNDGSLSVAPFKYDAFVRSLNAGITEIISTPAPTLPSLTPLGDNEYTTTSVSSNGQYVAFSSDAAGIDGRVTYGTPNVYVHNFATGGNVLVSANNIGTTSYRFGGNSSSSEPSISADGRFVAFSSYASDLVTNAANTSEQVFWRDMQTETCVLVSIDLTGTSEGNGNSYSPQISADGQHVLFFSQAKNLVSQQGALANIYWRDLQAGVTYFIGTNSAVAMTPDGSNVLLGVGKNVSLWNAQSHTAAVVATVTSPILEAVISADTHRAAFTIAGSGSQPPRIVYAADLVGNSNWVVGAGPATSQKTLQISGDGRFLAYVGLDSHKTNQMYLYDFDTGTNTLVSQAANGLGAGSDNSDSPTLNWDGSLLAYRSAATNLVAKDNNGDPDIFLYSRLTGQTTLISESEFGEFSANSRSMMPVFSADGSTLCFASWASDLAPGDFNESSDVFAVTISTNGGGSTGSTNGGPALTIGLPVELMNGQFSTNNPLTLTWPSGAGAVYEVQFKNDLTDPDWQPLNGAITIVSNQASVTDNTPSADHRYYRLLTH